MWWPKDRLFMCNLRSILLFLAIAPSLACTLFAADQGPLAPGQRLFQEGKYDSALLAFQVHLDSEDRCNALRWIGNTLSATGNFATARSRYDEAIDCLRGSDPAATAMIYLNIANTHYQQQHFDSALLLYEQSLAGGLPDRYHTTNLINQAECLRQLDRFTEASARLDLVNADSLQPFARVVFLQNRAALLLQGGDYVKAIRTLQDVVAFASAEGYQQEETKAYRNLFSAYFKLAEYDSAYRYYELAQVQEADLRDEEVAQLVSTLEKRFELQQKDIALERKQLQFQLTLVIGVVLVVALPLLFVLRLQRAKRQRKSRELILQSIISGQEAERKHVATTVSRYVTPYVTAAKTASERGNQPEVTEDTTLLQRILPTVTDLIYPLELAGDEPLYRSLLTLMEREDVRNDQVKMSWSITDLRIFRADEPARTQLYRIVSDLVYHGLYTDKIEALDLECRVPPAAGDTELCITLTEVGQAFEEIEHEAVANRCAFIGAKLLRTAHESKRVTQVFYSNNKPH